MGWELGEAVVGRWPRDLSSAHGPQNGKMAESRSSAEEGDVHTHCIKRGLDPCSEVHAWPHVLKGGGE